VSGGALPESAGPADSARASDMAYAVPKRAARKPQLDTRDLNRIQHLS